MMASNGELKLKSLVGKYIYLRPIEKGDIKYIRIWGNDLEIMSLTGEVRPMSQTDAEEFLKNVQNDKERVWFIMVLKENDQVIGEAGLLRMFKAWRTTDLSIIIGEKEVWGKGYGTEAIILLLDYAFQTLKFHRVAIGVVGFNERAIRFYEKVGFKKEGIQRDGYYHNSTFHDFIMMSILEDEFRKLHYGSREQRSANIS